MSLSRMVSFGRLSAELRDAHERLFHVDAAFNRATLPGKRVGEAFAVGAAAYAEHDFEQEEWRLHHQGGPTGYETREYLATAQSENVIEEGQAFSWNPTVPSLKSEDTIIARSGGPEILKVDDWPRAAVDGVERPLVLER